MPSEFDTAARAAVAAALRGEMSLLSAIGELASLARVLEAPFPEVLSALSFAGRAMPLASASETDLCELLASLRGLPLCLADTGEGALHALRHSLERRVAESVEDGGQALELAALCTLMPRWAQALPQTGAHRAKQLRAVAENLCAIHRSAVPPLCRLAALTSLTPVALLDVGSGPAPAVVFDHMLSTLERAVLHAEGRAGAKRAEASEEEAAVREEAAGEGSLEAAVAAAEAQAAALEEAQRGGSAGGSALEEAAAGGGGAQRRAALKSFVHLYIGEGGGEGGGEALEALEAEYAGGQEGCGAGAEAADADPPCEGEMGRLACEEPSIGTGAAATNAGAGTAADPRAATPTELCAALGVARLVRAGSLPHGAEARLLSLVATCSREGAAGAQAPASVAALILAALIGPPWARLAKARPACLAPVVSALERSVAAKINGEHPTELQLVAAKCLE